MDSRDSILAHYTGVVSATHSPYDCIEMSGVRARVPKVVQQWYANGRTCAGCRQSIHADVRHVVVGTSTYHPSCGAKARQQPTLAPKAASPVVLCRLSGVAVPLGVPCEIVGADGLTTHIREQYALDAFDRCLSTGPYLLKLNHETRIAGRWITCRADASALRFEYELFDTPFGRGIRDDIQRGVIQYCSIAYKRNEGLRAHYRGGTCVIDECQLTEISLLRGRRPAWYDTFVRVQ